MQLRAIVREVEDEFFAPLDEDGRRGLHNALLRLAVFHDPRCGPELE